MKKIFTSVIAALCLAAPAGNLSAQTSQQFTKSQEEAIKKELLPVVFEQIKEQAGIDILGWANPQLTNTFSSIPVLESSSLRAATANAVNVKPDSITVNVKALNLDILSNPVIGSFIGDEVKIIFQGYDTKTLPLVTIGGAPITVEMPETILIAGKGDATLATLNFKSVEGSDKLLDMEVELSFLNTNYDLLGCSLEQDLYTDLTAKVDIREDLRNLATTIAGLIGGDDLNSQLAGLGVDYEVTVGLSGLANMAIPASLFAIPETGAATARVPMGDAVVYLNLTNSMMPISKVDVTSYTAGNASAWSLFKLDASKTTTSTSAVTKIDIDKYSHSSAEKKDTTFVEKTVITMTDLTSSLPTTAKAAVQSVITRVVNELANEGKATWYELSIAKSKSGEEAEELVSIKVSPYISGTNAIADIDIVAGGSAYLVRATADMAGSQKIAVDVIQNETTYATAYFTSNILGAVTSNESVQVTDVKVIPMANAIRVLNADKASYQIYSISGAMMANGTIAGDAYISTANLAKGIYIVVVEANGVKQAVKFVR
ncbi:T9SS type A sorting domain-containing protein [Parabacteroides sp. AD58]|uniref:T9SS type A sorting domain-containing protein n=1 Tax=Parabacteroides absconsus TaxID=2951805 RepID=A0ABZ2IM15_9BACT|nr:T9SS type A sorting domain-containing protein [Parabacteroides sp. AD58]MCM6900939.1 T9SS type A sorting domain-containing protein [Parabacteroides sp. AD58]